MRDPLLQSYRDRPQLAPHLLRVWTVFVRLSRRRPVGFSAGAIPMTEFESYCRTFGYDDLREREWLFVRLDALDAAYLKYLADHAPKKEERA